MIIIDNILNLPFEESKIIGTFYKNIVNLQSPLKKHADILITLHIDYKNQYQGQNS